MRHEEKFICSNRQLTLIESRLKAVMPYDINQKGDDYRIRSLYFDTADDRMYNESLTGVDRRRKYRIRFYNLSAECFRMERKDTIGRLKEKYSAPVDAEFVRNLIGGKALPGPDGCDDNLLQEVYVMQQTEGLRPVAVVDYRRTAFTYPTGNVRITIDRDISCTGRIGEFLDDNALLYPVMPGDKHILEVKYDAILPGFIASVLDTGSLEQVSFSKYAYARSVMEGNGRKEDGYEF